VDTGKRTFSREDRLHHRRQFEQLAQSGVKVVNRQFVALYRPNGGSAPRLGVTVSRKVGNAVVRNRIKRLIREFFRHNRRLLGQPCDLNIIARPCTANLPSPPVFKALCSLFHDISGACQSKRCC